MVSARKWASSLDLRGTENCNPCSCTGVVGELTLLVQGGGSRELLAGCGLLPHCHKALLWPAQPSPEDIFLKNLRGIRQGGACLVSCPGSNQGKRNCLLDPPPLPPAFLLSCLLPLADEVMELLQMA